MSDNNYNERFGKLGIINSVALTDVRFDRVDWLTEGLLKPGLSVLAGAPKIGKSWMVLQLCLAVAQGKPFLGMATKKSRVLYISLEDSQYRLQERLNRISDEGCENLYLATSCSPLGEELAREITQFSLHHENTRLVVIDTFQKIREQTSQMSYSGDYADVSYMKHIADQLGITLLLVHHTRKMSDSDVLNEISGTNGIAGSADTLMILKKRKRSDRTAVFSCTGRDNDDIVMELELGRENCIWRAVSGKSKSRKETMPEILLKLIAYVSQIGEYSGGNTVFCERFRAYAGEQIGAMELKKLMNRFRYDLEDAGVYFINVRKHEGRLLAVYYKKREDGESLSKEDADEEQAMWDEVETSYTLHPQQKAPEVPERAMEPDREYEGLEGLDIPDTEEIPLPTDDDAPPATPARYRSMDELYAERRDA